MLECKDEGFDPEKKFNLTSLVRSVNCYFILKIAILFLSLFYAIGSIRDAYVAYIVTFTFLFT